jgi:hypothetical protein
MRAALPARTYTTSMLRSATNPRAAPTRQSKSCRPREGWRPSGSESFETSTRSSNTSEVGLPQLYSPSYRNARTQIKEMLVGVADQPFHALFLTRQSHSWDQQFPHRSDEGLPCLVFLIIDRVEHWLTVFSVDALAEVPVPSNNNNNNNNSKHMSEEETRDLIARQRSALYGEGPFAEKSGYIDENGNVRSGAPGPSGPPSLRGASPLTFDGIGRVPQGGEAATPGSATDPNITSTDPSPRPQSTSSPQTAGPANRVFDNAVGSQSRTSTSSPTGGSPPRDLAPGSKPGQSGPPVAPIGTRPSGTPSHNPSQRSTTPLATSGGWGRGNGVWGQSSGLGAQASVWG